LCVAAGVGVGSAGSRSAQQSGSTETDQLPAGFVPVSLDDPYILRFDQF